MASATVSISCQVQDTKSADLGTYTGNPQITSSTSLSSSDITKVFSDGRSVATTETLDVTSGLTDAYGTALNFATVKAFVVKNTHATATLTIGGGANPLFGTDQYTVKAGQTLAVTSQFAVSGSVKNILVTASASATYSVIILGA